jgi:translation initiation factor 2 subunit 3
MEELETINIGIVGHIDHGKTSILQKLSGKWADTHSEEIKRGITIKLGYADITLYKEGDEFNTEKKGAPIRHITFVDSPGHEMLMATMLSGAAIIDAAILVVAANEGIKPQTREHLMALQAKKIKYLIVIQNKIDLVDKDKAIKNYQDIKKLIEGKFDTIAIIPVSAQQGVNIDEVYKAIMEIPVPKRDESGDPIFLIARSFDINKPGTIPENLKGTVLGGTLKKGTIKKGDELEIKPGIVIKEANQYHYKTIKCKVIKLFNGSSQVDSLTPGGSASIETSLDMSIGKSDSLSGCIASYSGKLKEITQSLKIGFTLFQDLTIGNEIKKIEQIKMSEMLMLSINTSMTVGVVKKILKDEIELSLKVPIVPTEGDNVGIARNINNHWRLIGYGEIKQ